MEREQIIKILEHCTSHENCTGCDLYWRDCGIESMALALIKELAEENERLRAIPEQLHNEMSERMLEERKIERKLTVRKMHFEIKERCIKGGIYPAFVASTIDQIEKEMLEGEK